MGWGAITVRGKRTEKRAKQARRSDKAALVVGLYATEYHEAFPSSLNVDLSYLLLAKVHHGPRQTAQVSVPPSHTDPQVSPDFPGTTVFPAVQVALHAATHTERVAKRQDEEPEGTRGHPARSGRSVPERDCVDLHAPPSQQRTPPAQQFTEADLPHPPISVPQTAPHPA